MKKIKPYRQNKASLLERGATTDITRSVAIETPIALAFNGVAHVVMMISPIDIEDFVIGFSLSENIIERPSDITSIEIKLTDDGLLADIWIDNDLHETLINRRRNLIGQSSCGICGIEELSAVRRDFPKVSTPPKYGRDQLFDMIESIGNYQDINKKTGAVHAAAFVDSNGKIDKIREDVGRHNALDKLIGHCSVSGKDMTEGAILLTSRCSYELVQKAVAANVPLLITISVPTSMAIEIAEAHDLTLICLARSDNMLVFNDPFSYFKGL